MLQLFKPVLFTSVAIGCVHLTPLSGVAAQTLPMQVLQANSSNVSYAAAYFAPNATVTPQANGQYQITSTVTTKTELGDYPVQILTVNGQPVQVHRSANGTNQTITYTFVTNNLAQRHVAQIKVDVPSINYHHHYQIGLQLANTETVQPVATETSDPVKPSAASSEKNSEKATQTSEQTAPADRKTPAAPTKAPAPTTATTQPATELPKTNAVDYGRFFTILGGGGVLGILTAVGFILWKGRGNRS